MIADLELLELEILLIYIYKNHVFEKIFHNGFTNEIIAVFKDLEYILVKEYPDRHKVLIPNLLRV